MVYSVIVVPGMLGKAVFLPQLCLLPPVWSRASARCDGVVGQFANGDWLCDFLDGITAFSLVLGQQISVPVALGAAF